MANKPARSRVKKADDASSYKEWKTLALQDDLKSGLENWKKTESSKYYDYISVRQRLNRLRKLRRAGKNHELLFTLNEGIHGNIDGIGHPSLYSTARVSTKKLITDYINEVATCLKYLADLDNDAISFDEKLDFFRRADHCYGCTALMFSGAGALGFFHLGVISALLEQNVLPRVISGSSAGSLMAALLGTRKIAQLHEELDPDNLDRAIERDIQEFADRDPSLSRRLSTSELQRQIELWIPDLTFQEAYELSGRSISITVSATRKHQKSRLLNAITSPNVLIRTAVMASCAVPGVYPPVTLHSRDADGNDQPYLPKDRWQDGSLASDLPTRRLARLYGVNHYVVSQVNPLVSWSLVKLRSGGGVLSGLLDLGLRMQKEWLRFMRSQSSKYLHDMPRVNTLVDTFYSMASQEYTGDINIVPRFSFFNPTKLLSHLSAGDRRYLIDEGMRASWPKIEAIRNSSEISRTLNSILWDYEQEEVKHLALQRKHRRKAS